MTSGKDVGTTKFYFGSAIEFASNKAIDFAAIATFLLEALPPIQASNRESKEMDEDEMMVGDVEIEKGSIAIDSRFLLQMTSVLFGGISPVNGSHKEGPHSEEVVAVGAACAFLHVTLNILPLERTMTVLAYRTELVPVLWKFMKECPENQKWSALSGHLTYLSADAPGYYLCQFSALYISLMEAPVGESCRFPKLIQVYC